MIKRGDIWLVDFGSQTDENDHLQHGVRPVVIVSNDKANRNSPVLHCIPLTSRIHKKRYLPTHIFINGYETVGLGRHSIAECEQLQAVNYSSLMSPIGSVSAFQMVRIEVGIAVQLALNLSN